MEYILLGFMLSCTILYMVKRRPWTCYMCAASNLLFGLWIGIFERDIFGMFFVTAALLNYKLAEHLKALKELQAANAAAQKRINEQLKEMEEKIRDQDK